MFQNQKYRWVEEMRGSQNRKRVFDSVFGKDSNDETVEGEERRGNEEEKEEEIEGLRQKALL